MSRPVEDCDGCPALAPIRSLGLDDPSSGRPDLQCNFGGRSIRACRAAVSTQRKSLMQAVPAALLGTHLTAARFVNSSVFAGSGLRRRGPGCPGVEPRRISASVICCRVRCRSPWGKFAVKVGGGHAPVHGEVAAGDERPVGAHEQHADGPYLIWGAARPTGDNSIMRRYPLPRGRSARPWRAG